MLSACCGSLVWLSGVALARKKELETGEAEPEYLLAHPRQRTHHAYKDLGCGGLSTVYLSTT